MFSGIIEHTAKILNREKGTFRVENTFREPLQIGQSIAHDGACMTLTNITDDFYEFFVMDESLSVTNFREKKKWDLFNVERSMKLGDRIDGHMVTWHIDTVWKVVAKEYKDDGSCILTIDYPIEYDRYTIRKWSISVNGVSLTLVFSSEGAFVVSLIPLTQEWTNLGSIAVWESVNLEFDMFAKYIAELSENYLQKHSKSI